MANELERICKLLDEGDAELQIAVATGLNALQVGRRFALWGITLSILGVIASTAVLAYFLSNLDKYNIHFTR